MQADRLCVRILRIVTALVLSGIFFSKIGSGDVSKARAQGMESAGPSSQWVPIPPADHSVQFYKDPQFGQTPCYGDNAGDYPAMCSGYDNNVSSLVLKSGWSVRVYKEPGALDGTSKCFTATDDDLANDTFEDGTGVNNQISSFTLYNQASCSALIDPPAAPTLFNPGNNSAHPYNYDLTFQWLLSSGATEYLLEWWGGPYSPAQPCGWSNLATCHVGPVEPEHTYSWHVKARNEAGESPWSTTWSFTIRPEPPASFGKTGPLDSGTAQSTNPTLSWEPSSRATSYEYCFVAAGLGPCSNWTSNGTSTSKAFSGLDPFTTYYWNVRAVNAGGTTYSDGSIVAWSFTTGPSVDAYEPDNTSAQASTITSGSPQTHSILPAADVDWVKFSLDATSAVTLETGGATSSDTEMWLYDDSLMQMNYSNDEGAGAYSLINLTCGTAA